MLKARSPQTCIRVPISIRVRVSIRAFWTEFVRGAHTAWVAERWFGYVHSLGIAGLGLRTRLGVGWVEGLEWIRVIAMISHSKLFIHTDTLGD